MPEEHRIIQVHLPNSVNDAPRGRLNKSALVVGATMQKQNGGLHFLQFQLYGDKAHFNRNYI